MAVSLDLRKAHKHQRHGDLIVVLTWINDSRALVLLPALRRDAGWFCVDESAAYLWGVDHPDREVRQAAMLHTLRQGQAACQMLGLEVSRANVFRVISIVTGWLPDLIRMPTAPAPEYLPGSFGAMELRADGEVLTGQDIRVEREGVATYG